MFGSASRLRRHQAVGPDRPVARRPLAASGARRPGIAARGGAAALGGAGTGLVLLAKVVRLITTVVVAIIVAAILLRVLDANAGNAVVKAVHDAGRALVGPFRTVFTEHDPKASIALNWGLAALVYLIAGSLIAGALARAGVAGRYRAGRV